MGDSTAETSLCSEATFQQVLVAAIAQAVDQDGRDAGDGDGDTAARLRSKAAFVFKVRFCTFPFLVFIQSTSKNQVSNMKNRTHVCTIFFSSNILCIV